MNYLLRHPMLKVWALVLCSNFFFSLSTHNSAAAPLPPPAAPSRQTSSSTAYLYRVWIPTTNPWVLNRVRTIEPGAFVRRSQGAIQAGLFLDRNRAKTRIVQLTSLGFKGKVTTLPLFKRTNSSKVRTPTPKTPSSVAVIDRNLKLVPHSKYYFVVVPGGEAELATIEARLIGSGIERQAVLIRDQPLGAHVALGPFPEAEEAESWSKYLRGKGMDARVFFDR